MGKEKFESITITEKHTDTFVPFEFILNVPKASLPKESDIYYMMLSMCFQAKNLGILDNNYLIIISLSRTVMLNYREKHGEDPLPDERGCENLKNEASAIIKKYELEDKINHLVEYVYIICLSFYLTDSSILFSSII